MKTRMFSVIYLIIGILSAGIGIILSFFAGQIFGNSMTGDELGKAQIMMLILTFNVCLTFIFSIYSSIITANEQFVFQKYVENHHIQGIDEALSISKARVQQLLNRGCREVRGILRRRYDEERALQRRNQAVTCSVFAVGGATYETLKVFGSVAYFLIKIMVYENFMLRRSTAILGL